MFKLVVIALFLGALWFTYKLASTRLQPLYAVAVVLVIGFSPYMRGWKDWVLSETAFMFLALGTLYYIETTYTDGKASGTGRAVVIGGLMFLTAGARIQGMALVPAFLVYDMVYRKRLRAFPLVAAAIFAGLYAVQSIVFTGGTSYLDQMRAFTLIQPIENALKYAWFIRLFWDTGIVPFTVFLWALGAVLALIGLVSLVRQHKLTVVEYFLVMYVLILLLWPYRTLRFLLAVLPIYIIYIMSGIRVLAGWAARRVTTRPEAQLSKVFLGAYLLIVAVSYGFGHSLVGVDFAEDNIASPASQAMFASVRQQTEQDSVISYQRPRVIALFTERAATNYGTSSSPAQYWAYEDQVGVDYILVGPHTSASERLAVDTHPERVTVVDQGPDYVLYKVIPLTREEE